MEHTYPPETSNGHWSYHPTDEVQLDDSTYLSRLATHLLSLSRGTKELIVKGGVPAGVIANPCDRHVVIVMWSVTGCHVIVM